MANPIDREIRLALWKIHILHHAAKRPVYGLWMLEELAEHGHRVSPGTLYPIFTRMQANGWLRSDEDGPKKARRNYYLTAAGARILQLLRAEITECYEEVVLGKEPAHEHEEGETRGVRAAARVAKKNPRRSR